MSMQGVWVTQVTVTGRKNTKKPSIDVPSVALQPKNPLGAQGPLALHTIIWDTDAESERITRQAVDLNPNYPDCSSPSSAGGLQFGKILKRAFPS